MRIVARDPPIQRPIPTLASVGVIPVPGPFDELVLLLVAGVLFVFYRAPLREAWRHADAAPTSPRE
jgi:hypothetical protein